MRNELRIAELRRMDAPEVERRVLAAVICEPDKLAAAPDLETDDFLFLPHRFIFETLRNLQAADKHIGILEIADAIVDSDVALGTALSETVGVVFITDIVANSPRYEDAYGEAAAMGVFETDLVLLRNIVNARKAACA